MVYKILYFNSTQYHNMSILNSPLQINIDMHMIFYILYYIKQAD